VFGVNPTLAAHVNNYTAPLSVYTQTVGRHTQCYLV